MAPGKSDMWASGRGNPAPQPCSWAGGDPLRASPATGQICPFLQLAPCHPGDGSREAAAAASALRATYPVGARENVGVLVFRHRYKQQHSAGMTRQQSSYNVVALHISLSRGGLPPLGRQPRLSAQTALPGRY
jgi:hypothetical protein